MSDHAEQLSQNVFAQIDAICVEFRQAWKAGDEPDLQQQLERVPDPAQANLFKNLLQIDVRYRKRSGKTPTSSEYLTRFPEFAEQIRNEFDESTMLPDSAAAADLPAAEVEPTETVDLSTANRLGDYELIKKLGQGGMGLVFAARHRQTGNRVALKTLPSGFQGAHIDANRLHRFKKEFRSLAEINHPNLVGMQSLEVDGDQWFFTMDLIEGGDFRSYVRPEGKLNEERLRHCLPQLARGILALHRRGILHRDLKPSNVLVSNLGHVSILDFGLVAELRQSADVTQTRSAMFVGTPPYAAPEQFAGNKTEANDWYSFGTMLYEALTGDVPFRGSDPFKVLQRKQQEDPPQLARQADLPADLAALADDLIRRQLSERIGATEVAERLQLVAETQTQGSTRGSSGSHESTDSMDQESLELEAEAEQELQLVGREQHLAQLEAVKQKFLQGREPTIVWVTGLSGEGKSSLIEKFLRSLREQPDVLVLAGRCFERESIPFKAIDGWLDSLIRFLRAQSEEYLREVLSADMAGLAQMFPELLRVPLVAQLPSIDNALMSAEKLKHRSLGALRDLLIEVSKRTAIVLTVDDLQWGDADSVAAYRRILETPDAPAVLLLASYRSDEAEASPFLTAFRKLDLGIEEHKIEIGPLSESDAMAMFARQLPEHAPAMEASIKQACQEAGGNAYFLQQLIESFDPTTKTLGARPLREIISERLSRLPREAQSVLEILAVCGQPVLVREVNQLVGGAGDLFATLTRMRNEKLVRLLGDKQSQQLDTLHDKVRETVLDGLSSGARQEWHRSIAFELERLTGNAELRCVDEQHAADSLDQQRPTISRVFDLAYHFSQAEEPRAFDYQLWAGEQALQTFSNLDAIEYLHQALNLITREHPPAIQFRVLYGLGVACLRSRRTEEAIPFFEQALDHTNSVVQRVNVFCSLMSAHGSLGHTDRAIHYGDIALGELGRPRPRSTLVKLLRVIFTSLTLPTEVKSGQIPISDSERLANQLEVQVLKEKLFDTQERSVIDVFDVGFRASMSMCRSGDARMQAVFPAYAASLYSALGLLKKSSLHEQQIASGDLESLSPEIFAEQYFSLGMANYFLGRFDVAKSSFQAALSEANRCGDNRRALYALHVGRHNSAWANAVSEELELARQLERLANEVGDRRAICWAYYDLASAQSRCGMHKESLRNLVCSKQVFADERWPLTESIYGAMAGYVLMQCSAHDAARPVLSQSWQNVKATRLYFEYTVHSLPLLLESLLGPEWQSSMSHSDRKQASILNRWIGILYRAYPPLQPLMLRVQGRYAASRGKVKRARKKFERSAAVAEKYGMPYYRARVLLDLAAVQEDEREKNRAEAIRLLQEMESVIPRAESWQLGDQHDQSVVAPEFDIQNWEEENGCLAQFIFAEKPT